MGVGSADHDVSLQSGVSDLTADVSVGGTDDHPVLGGVVLVLVLDTETFSGEVVGLSLSTSLELWLVSLEVGLVLLNGNESLLSSTSSFGHGLSFDPNRSKK